MRYRQRGKVRKREYYSKIHYIPYMQYIYKLMPSPFIHSHLTQSSGWLPACEDWSKHEELSYGWERAIDSKGRSYYIK